MSKDFICNFRNQKKAMKKLLLAIAISIAGFTQAQNFTPTDEGSKLHFVIKSSKH